MAFKANVRSIPMYRRDLEAPPRLAREGWVPAGPEKRVNKRAMLIPKTGLTNATIPTLMDFSEVICPPERRALREIVETAEVVKEGGHLYLVARVSAATLDSLATFETSREDLEEEPDAEQVNEDGSDNEDGTNESSYEGHERGPDHRRYLAGRQERHRATYDRARDQDELRKVKGQVNALAAKKRKRGGVRS